VGRDRHGVSKGKATRWVTKVPSHNVPRRRRELEPTKSEWVDQIPMGPGLAPQIFKPAPQYGPAVLIENPYAEEKSMINTILGYALFHSLQPRWGSKNDSGFRSCFTEETEILLASGRLV